MTNQAISEGGAADLTAHWRHELRTPVNLIVGYCEMMLEDARAAGEEQRIAPLTDALSAVQDAIAAIDRSLPPDGDAPAAAVQTLELTLRDVQKRVTSATSLIYAAAATASNAHGSTRDDLRRVDEAAARLVQVAGGMAAAAAAAEPATGRPMPRVLVVDDLEANRELLARRLRREGCQVTLAESGSEALAAMDREPFDLVLLDVMMPDLSGVEVLQRMKSAPSTRDVPVLMVSALDDLDNVVRCIELGADDYLPKPFNPALLRARVRAALEKSRLRAAETEYLRAVRTLTQAAADVSAGRFEAGELSAVAARADELGQLARVFATMAEGVRGRERRLEAKLDALRAELGAVPLGAAGDQVKSDEAAEILPGAVIAGRYVIESPLGSGGMGVVYRAHDRELGDAVALKVLRRGLLADSTAQERLKAEIRLARRISHRNVVRTHDFGEADSISFVTMEFVDGMTLRRLLDERGPLDQSAVVALGAQIARALEVAHAAGVIHRDIKPPNLLLTRDGTLKVMDFGIARVADRGSALTQTGIVLGTPAYMAPEQLLGEEVDARADLYAVGVVLYESLTGFLPFIAETPLALIAHMLRDTPRDPLQVRPDLSPALNDLVVSLLSRDRAQRPANARQLAETLEALA